MKNNRLIFNLKTMINTILLPLKLLIPQPWIKKIPWLTTNEEIRINQVKKYIRGKCLDIGCGTNQLMIDYRAEGGDGIGVDVYKWENVDMVVEDTSCLTFEDKSFDCVTFVACINHIPNRLDVLKEACRILQDDGTIIITFLTPLISKVWHFLCFWDRDQHERGMKEGEVFGFTHKEFSSLMESAGLEIVKRKRFSWFLNNLYLCRKGIS